MCDKTLINDKRLTPTMELLRSGKTQLFREKDTSNRAFIDSGNCDVSLEHENKAMYAELIDGEWYWMNGCAECNGKPRDRMTYIECDNHNRCRVCSINRKDIKDKSVHGGENGWTCNACHDAEQLEIRRLAFDKLDGDDPDCYSVDNIICPHCGSIVGSDDIHESQDMDCHVCDGEMHLEVEYSFTYSTTVKGKRITK